VLFLPAAAALSAQVDGDIDSDDEEEDTGMGDINVDAPLTMEV
jgi:hypothetical protein